MANFKTDIAWSPNSGVQRQSEEVSGIMGIAPEDTQTEEQGFIESMMERLYDNFYDKDDAVDFFDEPSPVSTTTLPGSDWGTLEPIDELLRDYREGKTSIETIMPPMGQEPDSLAPSTSIRPKEKGSILARGMSPRPQARPVEEEEEQEVAAVEEEAATPTGAGLMSPPLDSEGVTPEADEEGTTTNTFATLITSEGSEAVDSTVPLTAGFDSLVEAEGTDIHLDGRGFVTLPYGIVPDSGSVKKADGTTFDPTGSHGLSASQLSGVDYSGATKFGLSRTDYDSDEAFAKAVYAEFGNRTANSYGEGFDDLTDEAKQAAYDMAWNAGTGSASWSSVQTMLTEASKDGDKSKDSLIGFTTNFRSGSDYPRGLLKRRLQTYNLVANEGEAASVITTTAATKDGKRTGTIYTVKDANGGVLKTWTKPDLDEVLGDLEVPQ